MPASSPAALERKKLRRKAYYCENRSSILAKVGARYESHKDKILIQRAEYRIANIEKIKAKDKAYRELNSEAIRAKKRDYYECNKLVILDKRHEYHLANAAQIEATKKIWRINNAEKYRIIRLDARSRRRAKERHSAIGPIDYATVILRCEGICGICSLPITGKFEFDHIVALANGGPHVTENIQVAHKLCNQKKGAR